MYEYGLQCTILYALYSVTAVHCVTDTVYPNFTQNFQTNVLMTVLSVKPHPNALKICAVVELY